MAERPRHQAVSVAVRVRPMRADIGETESGWIVREDENTLVDKSNPDMRFSFDYVFADRHTTRDIYTQCVEGPIVQSVMSGFNATVFAYGQTSSGKSYTMLGEGKQQGIVPLCVSSMFSTIAEQQGSGKDFVVKCSMLEIYNEQLRDLLSDSDAGSQRPLRILKSPLRGCYVEGAIRRPVTSTQQFVEYIHKEADARRVTAGHDMNSKSSRSHCIVRIDVECWESEGGAANLNTSGLDRSDVDNRREGDTIKVSTLSLVDLAGSERISKTGATQGIRKQEGSNINKSLLFLGTVIERLSDPDAHKKGQHIPYRDSLLTRILESSLGGNSVTMVVAAITQADIHCDETRSTLQFAYRASRVRNLVHKNEISDDKSRIRVLTAENKSLRKALVQRQLRIFHQALRIKRYTAHNRFEDDPAGAKLLATVQKENKALQKEVEMLRAQGGGGGGGGGAGSGVNEHRFNEMKALVSKYERQVAELEDDIRQLQEQQDTMETLCRDVESDADAKSKKLDKFRQEKKAAEAALTQARAENAELSATVAALQADKSGFAARLEREVAEAQAAGTTDAALKQDAAALRQRLNELEERNRSLAEQCSKAGAAAQQLTAAQGESEQERVAEVRKWQERVTEQARLCRTLLAVAESLHTGGGGGADEAAAAAAAATEVRQREVDQAVKQLRGFIASRQHHPPGVVPSSSAAFVYEPPVSQLKQLQANNAKTQRAVEPVDDEGFTDQIRIKGMPAPDAATAAAPPSGGGPVRRRRPPSRATQEALEPAAAPEAPAAAAASGVSDAEVAALKKRVAELEEMITLRDSQRDVIIDAKLKRMQDLLLRIYNNWTNLQASVRKLTDESSQLKDFVRLRKLSHKLPANLSQPTPAADEVIAAAQSKPIRDHPSWPPYRAAQRAAAPGGTA
eukprot:Rhum_TRINITY_DN10180_c1_g1::Rhum_TRINITY_DN10180_c1_g1_i1::g.37169::m.37169/K11498/CENPE; centromeric protein E